MIPRKFLTIVVMPLERATRKRFPSQLANGCQCCCRRAQISSCHLDFGCRRKFSSQAVPITQKDGPGTRKDNRVNPSSTFLMKVERKEISKDMICQRVEELLLQTLNRKLSPNDGPLALEILRTAIRHANLPHERLVPRLFSLACQVMLNCGHRTALNDIQKQIWDLLDNHRNYLTADLEYNSHHVNDACAQFINGAVLESNRSKRKIPLEQRNQIQALIERLQQLYDDESVPLVANIDSCNAFVMFHCNQEKPQVAYNLLKWMVDESPNHPVDISPRTKGFTAAISSFGKRNPDSSLEVLQWMIDLYKKGAGPPPNTSCFNGLLDAWARSRRRDAGERAEQTLEWMQLLHDTKGMETAPDEISYNCCINAWANSLVPNAANRAEAVLRKVISMYEQGSSIAPGNYAFNSAMNAWANSGSSDAPARVADLLETMKRMATKTNAIEINSFPYSTLLKAWEKLEVGHAKAKAEDCVMEILKVVQQMDEDKVEKTPIIHNSAIMAISKFSVLCAVLYFLNIEDEYRNGRATMDVRTFNSGLSAVASLNKPDLAERAMEIVNRMKQYAKTDPAVKPNQMTSNVLLKILSRSPSPNAAAKADELLRDMESGHTFEASQASYVTVIIAWGRSSDANLFHRVQDLLKRYDDSVNAGVVTNLASPNVYNAALSVCRFNAEDENLRDQALETVLVILEQLRNRKEAIPDELTYLTLFEALDRMMINKSSTERRQIFEREFSNCINDGLVSRKILEVIHSASPQLFEKFFGDAKSPAADTVPKTWTKNLRAKNARR